MEDIKTTARHFGDVIERAGKVKCISVCAQAFNPHNCPGEVVLNYKQIEDDFYAAHKHLFYTNVEKYARLLDELEEELLSQVDFKDNTLRPNDTILVQYY